MLGVGVEHRLWPFFGPTIGRGDPDAPARARGRPRSPNRGPFVAANTGEDKPRPYEAVAVVDIRLPQGSARRWDGCPNRLGGRSIFPFTHCMIIIQCVNDYLPRAINRRLADHLRAMPAVATLPCYRSKSRPRLTRAYGTALACGRSAGNIRTGRGRICCSTTPTVSSGSPVTCSPYHGGG